MTSAERGAEVRVPWRQVGLFCLLAYGLSWLWWAPLVLPHLDGLSLSSPLPDLTRNPAVARLGLGMFGPLLAAVVMRLAVSREGIKGTLGIWRSWRWYLIAFAAPALFVAILILINHLTGWGRFVWSGPLPLFLVYPFAVIVNGALGVLPAFGEEYGWRGYLLPRLLPLGEVKATLALGLIWGLWHVPALLIGLNYPGQRVWAALAVFGLNSLLLAFPFTWLYLASRSAFVVAVLHAALNAAGDTFTTPAHIPAGNPLIVGGGGLVTAALLLVAVVVVYGLRKRPTRVTNVARFLAPYRKGGRLDWLLVPLLAAVSLGACLRVEAAPRVPAPRADHHAHLRSAADAEFIARARKSQEQEAAPEESRVLTAAELIAGLDAGRVRKAAVLSTAYFFGMPEARAENDWVARQVARYPRRLVGFCGVNPLAGHAVPEIRRCETIGLRGLKLHLANSPVDLRNPGHLARLEAVFAAANQARFAIVVHLRTSSASYGEIDARAFIERVLPAAPDVPVQIAHMAGWGGFDRATDDALGAFVESLRQGRGRGRLYFDLSGVLLPRTAYEAQPGARLCFGEELRLLAEQQRGYPGWERRLKRRIRELGVERVLFATDWPVVAPAGYQALLQEQLDLSPRELRRLSANVAPYLR